MTVTALFYVLGVLLRLRVTFVSLKVNGEVDVSVRLLELNRRYYSTCILKCALSWASRFPEGLVSCKIVKGLKQVLRQGVLQQASSPFLL